MLLAKKKSPNLLSFCQSQLKLQRAMQQYLVSFRHFTRFHHPLHGNCYTFNSGENGTILSTSTGGSEYGKETFCLWRNY